MANTHNQVVSIATDGIGGYDIRTYGKGNESFTICTPTKMKESELMPCFVSHTDTVSTKKPRRFELKEGILTNPDGVLGADDRAGCYILSKMMENSVRGIYIFTNGEEIGGLGASACVKSQQFQDLVPHITAFIELDRQDDLDIACYGYDNEDLIGLFEQRGYKEAYGSYTDVVDFAEDTNIACINLSVGYRGQHTKKEDLVLADLDNTLDMMLTDLPVELYTEVYEATMTSWRNSANNYDYGFSLNKSDEVCCEMCSDHEKLYYVGQLMVCAYCADSLADDYDYDESEYWEDADDRPSSFQTYVDDDIKAHEEDAIMRAIFKHDEKVV